METTIKKIDAEAAKNLFLEQAAAYYDELREAAKNAPYGKVLKNAEALAVAQGRELLRKSLENVVQQQEQDFEQEEKKRYKVPLRRNSKTSWKALQKNSKEP